MTRQKQFVLTCSAALLLALSAWGLEETAKPQITSEQRARFWRANAEVLAAQTELQQAQAKMQAATEEMRKVCGEQQLTSDPYGEPTCKPKSQPPKAK